MDKAGFIVFAVVERWAEKADYQHVDRGAAFVASVGVLAVAAELLMWRSVRRLDRKSR
jgi:hypothetical protein